MKELTTEQIRGKLKELIQLCYDVIKDEGRWTQGWYAKCPDGTLTVPTDKTATTFCLVGIIKHIIGCHPTFQNYKYLEYVLTFEIDFFVMTNYDLTLMTFNDMHSHQEVITMWQNLAEKYGVNLS